MLSNILRGVLRKWNSKRISLLKLEQFRRTRGIRKNSTGRDIFSILYAGAIIIVRIWNVVASVVSSFETFAIFQINHRHKAWLENPIAFKSRTGWCSKLSFPRAWSNCYRRCVIVHCYGKVVRWTVAITTKRRRKTVIEWLCSASIRTSFRIFSNIYPASGALATRAFLSIVRSQL